VRFNVDMEYMTQNYVGEGNPIDHVVQCEK
jgi:hypothetical protein